MSSGSGSGSGKVERKTIEKNRRRQMKYLCFELISLIPPHHFNPPKEYLTQEDQFGEAADYIKKLSARVEELKKRKVQASSIGGLSTNSTRKRAQGTRRSELLPVIIRVRDISSMLEVVLISGVEKKIILHQVIRLLEEEGTEVVSVSLSNQGQNIFHVFHAQAKLARIGVDISRICVRLEELTC